MGTSNKKFQVIYDGDCVIYKFETRKEAEEYMDGWKGNNLVFPLLTIKQRLPASGLGIFI
ncbi:MAG: hypothetical protein ACKVIT_08320 [Candidatus Puniceispirillales bacterium]|jgi:hypothetical protein|tara:strand:+ start:1204 stop:1383 length:180 start_codon:yes stop_codon:yes gene_type:complete